MTDLAQTTPSSSAPHAPLDHSERYTMTSPCALDVALKRNSQGKYKAQFTVPDDEDLYKSIGWQPAAALPVSGQIVFTFLPGDIAITMLTSDHDELQFGPVTTVGGVTTQTALCTPKIPSGHQSATHKFKVRYGSGATDWEDPIIVVSLPPNC
jgi:hypothetical protein